MSANDLTSKSYRFCRVSIGIGATLASILSVESLIENAFSRMTILRKSLHKFSSTSMCKQSGLLRSETAFWNMFYS